MGDYFISSERLWNRAGSADAPAVLDVRRRAVFDADDAAIPGSLWCDPAAAVALARAWPATRPVVVSCAHGHQLSQGVAASLRADGRPAAVHDGGFAAWREAGLPVLRPSGLPQCAPGAASLWITRRRPKVDRVACPWLIRRFVDPRAAFLFVEPDQVLALADETGGIAFDIDGAPYSHDGARCSFDVLLACSGIADPALADLATIVRGADTARLDLAPQSAGLLAMALGLSALAGDDDRRALEAGMTLYDALYAWRRHAPGERHSWPAAAA
ncbi:MAG: chromate resistance protein [Alphaproteobacteria bacterium]